MKKNTSGRKPQKLNSPYEARAFSRLQHMFTTMTVIAVLMAVLISVAGATKLVKKPLRQR